MGRRQAYVRHCHISGCDIHIQGTHICLYKMYIILLIIKCWFNLTCLHGTFYDVIYLVYVSHKFVINLLHERYILFIYHVYIPCKQYTFLFFVHDIRPAPPLPYFTCRRTIARIHSVDAAVYSWISWGKSFLCMDGYKVSNATICPTPQCTTCWCPKEHLFGPDVVIR